MTPPDAKIKAGFALCLKDSIGVVNPLSNKISAKATELIKNTFCNVNNPVNKRDACCEPTIIPITINNRIKGMPNRTENRLVRILISNKPVKKIIGRQIKSIVPHYAIGKGGKKCLNEVCFFILLF